MLEITLSRGGKERRKKFEEEEEEERRRRIEENRRMKKGRGGGENITTNNNIWISNVTEHNLNLKISNIHVIWNRANSGLKSSPPSD
ncbi:unnamed protein product, partial [Pleuronectes platessa]